MNTLFKTITCPESRNDNDVIDLKAQQSLTQSIHIKDLEFDMFIGVSDIEKEAKQRVIINAEFDIVPDKVWRDDNIDNTVCYMDIISLVKEIADKGHIELVETFAYKIIEGSFKYSPKIKSARVTVQKPDIIEEAGAVGCTIFQKRD